MPTIITPREYQDYRHTAGLATSDVGSIWMQPTKATHIYFDAAKSNYLPALKQTGEHGSTVLDIGRGVMVRVSGHAHLVDGVWTIDPGYFYVDRDTGGDVTHEQKRRALAVVEPMIQRWADDHPSSLVVAEHCDRNNGARTLEENISRHVAALKVLRRELRACDGGRAWSQYPDLPTSR